MPDAPLPIRDNAAWLAHWKRLGPQLQRIRDEELRRMTEEERRVAVQDLFAEEWIEGPERRTSELVEWCRRIRAFYEGPR